MKRTGLKRATSGVLSVAMIASALFSDFSVPASVFASDDTSSVETTLDGYSDSGSSITSEYIATNLDESLGEEAAALNEDAALIVAEEYLVSELAETSDDADVEVSEDTDVTSTDTETAADTVTGTNDVVTEIVSVSSNDADIVSTSSNDVGAATLSLDDETDDSTEEIVVEETDVTSSEETGEVTVSEEDVAALAEEILESADDITAAEDYDTNGLAPTYHYITLNYSLIDSDYVWDGMTIDDVWNEVPESFIASYLTYVNVYTLEGNEDYYVAFIDPAALNGLGSAIYADFTDLDTYNPTVYNDIITFDAETGIVYIPKSFYFNEEGGETLKELEAQVLVPYSFDDDTSTVSVSVSSDMDGVEGISGSYSVPTLDVTMTIQIVDAEDADKISIDDIIVSVNDDLYAYDLSDGNGYYDTETGELTISASPNSVYSVNVTISEDVAEETLASVEQREILVASIGDLSGIIAAETALTTDITYATSAEDMKTVPGVTVTVDEGELEKGQTFTYNAPWATTISSIASTVNAVIQNTAVYSYYGFNGSVTIAVNDNDIFDSSGNFVSAGDVAYIARNGDNSTWAYNPYNRMVKLPDGEQLTSTSGSSVTTTWDVGTISSVSGYENYIAVSCVHNASGIEAVNAQEGTSDINIRVLYVKQPTNTSVGYMVFSATLPQNDDQAGSAVFKVKIEPTESDYYARFGIKKVSSTTGNTISGATFSYSVGVSLSLSTAKNYAFFSASISSSYAAGTITDTGLEGACSTMMSGTYISSSGVSYKTLKTENNTIPASYVAGNNLYIYITEVVPPDGYQRNTGVWILEVSVSDQSSTYSKIVNAWYYDYDVDSGTLSSTSSSVEYTSGTAYIIAPNDEITYYGAMNLKKVDAETGEPVVGAVLELYVMNDDGSRGELVDKWTTDGTAHYIERLDKCDYILVETYAPGKYVSGEMTFTVVDTDEVQTFTMEDDITKALFAKVDIETGEYVIGAVLALYATDENGNKADLVEEWTTVPEEYPEGNEGHYIEGLEKGIYILSELYAPGSYVTADDMIVIIGDTPEVQTFTMEDDFTKVEISKTDIVNGEEVEGATLTIYSVDENGERTPVETWTSTTEPHYIERLDKGDYVLVEEYAPTCYVTANEVEFTVEDTGEIQKVEMVDDITKVEISKTDMVDCEEVMGATLTVYKVNEDGSRTLIDTWVTDGTPYTIERLDKGTYVLVEENTPDGYQVAEEVTFEVIDTGEIQKVEMKDARTYGKVVVEKKDEDGKPLAGVEFTITNKDTGEIVDVITTDENGHAESKEMPIDDRAEDQSLVLINYTIQETKTASADYVLDDTITEFTFKYVDDKTPVVTYNYGATNELQKGRIAVMKKGLAAVDTTKVETVYGVVEKLVYDYIYLPGVEFTIYADEDLTEVVATITTDKDGAAYSDYLPVGTYYVVETFTPAGYVADDTVYTVNITGDGTGNLYVLDVTKDIVNHPCSVTINIYKEGSFLVSTEAGYEEKTEPLEGVVIGIYAAEDIANYLGTTVIDKDTLIAVLVTDEEGLATMTETLPAGSYYFKELKTLDNYVLDETKHEFSVSYENDNTTIEVNKENPLINYPQSGTLTVNKVDQNGNPLGAGVEFLVTCVDTGETWTIVTDANGIATLTDLSIGAYDENGTWVYYTYTLQETKTLDNYKLDDTVYTWQFTADNTNANAVSQTFTVRNVILGIVDYSAAGGAGMLMLALVLVLMAIRKKKEDEEIEAVAEVTEPSEI